jgi:hypothetical protein
MKRLWWFFTTLKHGYGFKIAVHVALAEEPRYAFIGMKTFLRAKDEL